MFKVALRFLGYGSFPAGVMIVKAKVKETSGLPVTFVKKQYNKHKKLNGFFWLDGWFHFIYICSGYPKFCSFCIVIKLFKSWF